MKHQITCLNNVKRNDEKFFGSHITSHLALSTYNINLVFSQPLYEAAQATLPVYKRQTCIPTGAISELQTAWETGAGARLPFYFSRLTIGADVKRALWLEFCITTTL